LRSQSAVEPIEEAVSEIKKAGLKDYDLGCEEAVLFLEKVSQAIEQVDSSSDGIGIIERGSCELRGNMAPFGVF
jgi:hypothetical protein